MTDEELLIREKVWEALSNFYLDTELDDSDYNYIFKIFIESKLSLEKLKEIDLFEVFPTLQMNLLSVAGEWGGFNKEWLNEKCSSNYKKKNNSEFRFVTKAKNKLHYWMRKDHWREIEARWEPVDSDNQHFNIWLLIDFSNVFVCMYQLSLRNKSLLPLPDYKSSYLCITKIDNVKTTTTTNKAISKRDSQR